MANIRITDLVTLTEPVSTDVLPIVDVSLDVTKKISIAEILRTAVLGSQTDPGISFDGDADTGVYSPGANQLAFTTNGAEALRIDSDGLIGIGTTDPIARLNVKGISGTYPTQNIQHSALDVEGEFLRISRTTSVVRYHSMVARQSATTTTGNNYIQFKIHDPSGGQTAQNTALHLDGTGNVGIGTTNPEAKLSIVGTNTNGGIKIVDSSTSASSPGIEVIAKRGDINDSTTFSGKLLLARNRTEAAIVADNQLGSVSFGGNHTDGTEANILYSAALIGVADGDFNDASDMPTALAFYTGSTGWSPDTANASPGTERLRITSDGKVGIGTTDPQQLLEIAAEAPRIRITDNNTTATTSTSYLEFYGSNARSAVIYTNSDGLNIWPNNTGGGNLIFQLGTSEKMRIIPDGRVGIGTTDPGEKLSIKDSTGAIINLESGVNLADLVQGINLYGRFVDGVTPPLPGQLTSYIHEERQGSGAFAQTFGLSDGTNDATERMRISSDGFVGIGTTAPEAKLTIVPGSSALSTIGGRSINYGANLESTSGRSGFLVRVNNNFTGDDDNSGFQWLYPFDSGGSSDYKVYRSATGSTLVDKFWVNQGGGGYFAGSVGIGTTDPDELLHIEGDAAEFKCTNTNSINAAAGTEQVFKFGIEGQKNGIYGPAASIIFRQDSSTWSSVSNNQKATRIEFCTQSADQNTDNSETPRLVINNAGNVGIGTTSPVVKLEVSAANVSELLRITRTVAGEQAGIGFSAVGTTSRPLIGCRANDFVFDVGGSEAARIDSSGRLLVGTSSSRAVASITDSLVQVETTTNFALSLAQNANNNGAAVLSFGKSRGTAPGGTTSVLSGDDLGSILFAGADGTDMQPRAAFIICSVDGTPGPNNMPGRLVFATTVSGAATPTERMDIKSDGRQRNFSSGATIFEASSSKAAGTTDFIFVGKHSGTAFGTGTNAFFVFTNGDVRNINNAYGSISDSKLKENIVNANSQWDDLKALQVRNYNFKEETGHQTHTQIGLVAQEAELVSPGLVSESPDLDEEGNDLGTVTKSVNYSVLYIKAVKALQEAMERIETLEQRLTDAGI